MTATQTAQWPYGETQPQFSDPVPVKLHGGTALTPEQAATALNEALGIIEKVGTTGINHAHADAREWLKAYYPAWA